MKDLKECPFCGSAPVESRNFGRYAITCHECGVSIRSEEVCGEGTVKERWNSRSDGWVKVGDRLPEMGLPVMIFTEYGKMATVTGAVIQGGGIMWTDWMRPQHTYGSVTHWQPLPPAPEVE